MKRIITFVPVVLITIRLLIAQDSETTETVPIFTDRSSQTDAVSLMPKGRLQFELGYFLAEEGDFLSTEFTSITVPNIQVKYSLTSDVEIRLFINNAIFKVKPVASPSIKEEGIAPLGIGFKTALLKGSGWVPDISYGATFFLQNTGKEIFQTDELTTSMRFLFENALTDNFSLDYSIGFDWSENGDAVGAYTLMGSFGIADGVGAWVELFSNFDEDITNPWGFDAGLAYALKEDLQLDASFGVGLNEEATDFFFNLGAAWKVDLLK